MRTPEEFKGKQNIERIRKTSVGGILSLHARVKYGIMAIMSLTFALKSPSV